MASEIRKKRPRKDTFSVRLKPADITEVKKRAGRVGVPHCEYIRTLVEAHLTGGFYCFACNCRHAISEESHAR